jgi:hypothetical protein
MTQEQQTVSSGLTSALAAAQARLTGGSTKPAGLSEHLVRQQQASEPVNVDAEIESQVVALSGAIETLSTNCVRTIRGFRMTQPTHSTSSCSAALIRISGLPLLHLDPAGDLDVFAFDAG